jgi:hypothetical protein
MCGDYFGFAHARSAIDFTGMVAIPYSELGYYLKSDSVLRRLIMK